MLLRNGLTSAATGAGIPELRYGLLSIKPAIRSWPFPSLTHRDAINPPVECALLDLLFQQRLAGCIHDANYAVACHLESLVVRSVFLGLLRHQADIGDAAHGHRVKS